MKKISRVLLIGLLFGLTSCVYLGLSSKEVKKHNSLIKEQIAEFPFENFDIEFYYFPNEERHAFVNCVNGIYELLVFEDGNMCYNYDGDEICYDFETKQEITYKKAVTEYSYYEDALALVKAIQDYQRFSKSTTGRRAMDEDEDGYLDEVTHYFYNMDWEYLDCAELDFYVTEDTSKIKRIFFTDRTNNWQLDRRHFEMHAYLNYDENSYTLRDSYEWQKAYDEAEKEEEEKNKDKVDLSFYSSGFIS
ncbi:MAG: hypothetical protein K2J93_05375 [Anaeroplasmataceae bacterium]|nr:hypothetical protein [Anaeroplasmataceae bacterium]